MSKKPLSAILSMAAIAFFVVAGLIVLKKFGFDFL